MILKSDGAALYDTTDLATLVEREEQYHPDEVIYVVDKPGTAFRSGVPVCKEGRDRASGDKAYIPWIRHDERKGRQAV